MKKTFYFGTNFPALAITYVVLAGTRHGGKQSVGKAGREVCLTGSALL